MVVLYFHLQRDIDKVLKYLMENSSLFLLKCFLLLSTTLHKALLIKASKFGT